jgi:hypothetical protein
MSLDRLRERYPLDARWGEPTVFVETTDVAGVQIHVAGIYVRDQQGDVATGSAGDLVESPLDRAYFELLERASILAMSGVQVRRLPTRSASGLQREHVDMDLVAPANVDSARWRYSKSNGVAVAQTWDEACSRAQWELIERDRILRSWYGELVPVRAVLPPGLLPTELCTVYSFEAYLFPDPNDSDVDVAGVFAFPKRDDAPLLYGFGARPSSRHALVVALGECIQRLGFLWGEDIPVEQPDRSPTPDFHQEFFLWRGSHDGLRDWLKGRHKELGVELHRSKTAPGRERRFVDLTPPELSLKLFVAKALAESEIPLVFGDGHPAVAGELPDNLRVHPVS